MAVLKCACALLVSAATLPPEGSVTVIGSGSARGCYEAASSPVHPSPRGLATCDRAIEREALSWSDLIATYVNRGIVRSRSGDNQGGIADFDAALQISPLQPEAYLNKGVALLRTGAADAAVGMFDRALELGTRRPALAHFGRAIAFEEIGEVAAAYREYRRASELDPVWAEPRDQLRRFRIVRPGDNG